MASAPGIKIKSHVSLLHAMGQSMAGLQDGIFSKQKFQTRVNFGGP
jgi:hypothetical protein